jgi:hypothetical protein
MQFACQLAEVLEYKFFGINLLHFCSLPRSRVRHLLYIALIGSLAWETRGSGRIVKPAGSTPHRRENPSKNGTHTAESKMPSGLAVSMKNIC